MEKVTLTPYLFFQGNCQEAMEFYKDVFGGDLKLQKFDDMPEMKDESMKGKIMHASLSGESIELMASDSSTASPAAKKIELCLSGTDEVKLRKIFDGLSQGGKVKSPLKQEFWGDIFGNLTDKFDIDWMMSFSAKK